MKGKERRKEWCRGVVNVNIAAIKIKIKIKMCCSFLRNDKNKFTSDVSTPTHND